MTSPITDSAHLQTLIASEFPQQAGLCYLNHAAVSPWPQRAATALAAFAQENVVTGAFHYPRWLQIQKTLRERLARLVGATTTEEIALVKNTSEGLSLVAFGLDWREGDEIIISNQEFPSNRVVWQALESRFGVIVKQVDLASASTPELALLGAVNGRTRLLSISSVQYGSGLQVNTHTLGTTLRAKGVLFCVDAIQSLGARAFSVQEDCIDFLVADGHKWMMGPEGLGVFYIRQALIPQLKLHQYGWHMLAQRGNYDIADNTPATNATRFECGSPNLLGIVTLEQSLALLEAIGFDQIEARLHYNINYLKSILDTIPQVSILSDLSEGRSLGILTFSWDGIPSASLWQRLMKAEVVCASRGGGVRFSPHFYTSHNTLDIACNRLISCVSEIN